jgi:hypothetical protein
MVHLEKILHISSLNDCMVVGTESHSLIYCWQSSLLQKF